MQRSDVRAQFTWWTTLCVGLLLQTSFLPHLVPDLWRPDFTRALVLWLALTGLPRQGVWYAFAAGLLVDVLSGTPLGFTALLRLAVYGAARPGRNALERSPLVFLLGPFAVAVETLLVLLIKGMVFANNPGILPILGIGLRQALLEVVSVPVIFVILELASGYRTEWGSKFAHS